MRLLSRKTKQNPNKLILDTRSTSGRKTWFCIRQNGVARKQGWTDGSNPARLRDEVGASPDEVVEVCVTRDERRVSLARFNRYFYPRVHGIIGMEIHFGGESLRLAPTDMLARNLRFDRALERFLEDRGLARDDFASEGYFLAFSAEQLLLPHGNYAPPVRLYRGSTLVEAGSSVGQMRTADLADGIGKWMLNNLSTNGGIPYKYWPSRGLESPADNAIRRFLASLALARLGKLQNSAEIREAARRNLCFNLSRYFREIGEGCGAIVETTGAKLGASALAGLAILEFPERDSFSRELAMLAAGIHSLAHGRLGFRTFFFPPERDGENWNFYSGEALLFWAEARRRRLSVAPTLERLTRAFQRCRERHIRNRNPAFVPWHTQACASLYVQTGSREFADFVFEMSDWLLPMQQWDGLEPDLCGRFYNPRRPDFGPPHAASTGAYLEGLADAAALARVLGDERRTLEYERVIHRGLRSLQQLQFRDDRDTFYINRKSRVLGALRTEVYDNSVRVDSAAHALLAAIKVLRPMTFGSLLAASSTLSPA